MAERTPRLAIAIATVGGVGYAPVASGTFGSIPAVLLYWFGVFVLAHDWLHGMHSRWFSLSAEQFDAIHYASMAFFKLCIFLFNLAPYIALHIAA